MSELTPEQIAAKEKKEADAKAKAEQKAREAQEKKDAKAKERQEKKDAKAAEAQANKDRKAAEKKAKQEEADKLKAAREAARVEKNGIVRPMTGATKKVWDIADAISAETKAPAERAAVVERAKAEGVNEGTVNTQYGRWRKYHGLTTLREQNATTKAKEREEAKAAKEAAEARAKAEAEQQAEQQAE